MNDIILNGIVGITTAILTWVLARRKRKIDEDNSVIEGLGKALEIYRKISDDNKQRIDENQRMLNDVLEENLQLKTELATLKAQVELLLRYNCMRANCPRRLSNSDDILQSTTDKK